MPVAKIYGLPLSTCAQRVMMALHEHNVPFEFVPVSFAEIKESAHLARQPFGQMPVFEDVDGFQVYESRAIIHYIDAKYKGQGNDLVPADIKQAALVEQWLSVEYSNFNPATTAIVTETVFKPHLFKIEGDMANAEAQAAKLAKILDVYEQHLSKNEYLANNQFSLADLAHLPYGQHLARGQFGHLITSRPHVNAWWNRITSRPTWQKVLSHQ
ncbi:glutathione transferase [Capsaspora owczarzaki ATCC 30864]|uniref:glutathione transferase n=1 Tax=Capsaspora owczarzaki (strain ATCC 30864) TaxID=595528 RepID=A0A0D2WLY1_CAPO3|nr:glutathione transferase [Capsaspora owczarzaki ATCC 30864]KJE91695.1 glutathione transferase [Capsaspora owczarzaki ATCC 30864]|eukprot:XP_004349545.1 glutathione transferase [Capsaspora owczarzaki ATCC 30864]